MRKTNLGNGKRNGRNLIIVSAIAAMMMIGGVSAYFTSTDNADNTWTVGGVTIDLVEEEYDKATDEKTDITPNMDLAKDPVIKNTGDNPAFVFVKVSIPKADVKVASDDGTTVTQSVQELFDYSINSGWTLVNSEEGTNSNTYLYAYGTAAECQQLAPQGETPVLFANGTIKFKNVVEGQGLEGTTLEIPVKAYGIQTNNITQNNVTEPSAVWAVLSGQAGSQND